MTKFKVWCKDKNEWEKDLIFIGQDGQLYHMQYDQLIVTNQVNHIACWSSGCYDHNKREIYQGDIYRRWYYPDYKDYTIEYEDGGFFLGDELLIDIKWESYEYMGNKNEK